jgi:molybdenum cofactor cytidylyltransferase
VEADAAIVILADMPLVTAPMLRATAARHGKTGAPLVVSRYGAVDGPPTLYHRSLFPEILALDGAHCGKRVAARHEREADVLTWPEEALYDVDVSEDYEGLPVSSRG